MLPCLGVLVGRHVSPTSQCQVYLIRVEEIQHCLFFMPMCKEYFKGNWLTWRDTASHHARPVMVAYDGKSCTSHCIYWVINIGGASSDRRMEFVVAKTTSDGESIQSSERSALAIKVLTTNYIRAATNNQLKRQAYQVWKKPNHEFIKMKALMYLSIQRLYRSFWGNGAR